jgi:histidine triad (HIT) family protein
MNNTVFGKIIRGEIPATKVYENDSCLAFLDINPHSKGHTLLIPKEHFVWMQEVPDELLSSLFIQTKKIMIALKEALSCDFVEVQVLGIDVPHFHIHLIPRKLSDDPHTHTHVFYDEGEMETIAEKIKILL